MKAAEDEGLGAQIDLPGAMHADGTYEHIVGAFGADVIHENESSISLTLRMFFDSSRTTGFSSPTNHPVAGVGFPNRALGTFLGLR